jgi:hypothetical protein
MDGNAELIIPDSTPKKKKGGCCKWLAKIEIFMIKCQLII